MLRTRLLTAIVLIPAFVCSVFLGGLLFWIIVAVFLTLAEFEFCALMTRDGFRPFVFFGIGLVLVLLLDAEFPALGLLKPALIVLVLASLAWQLRHRGGSPVADWSLTVVGGLYLGLCGACLIGLRRQPDGLWWTMIALPGIMLADSAAFLFGRLWGRHKLAPLLSPGKTWEGYLAGVIVSGALSALLACLWRAAAGDGTSISVLHGLILGLLVSAVAPLGDLAVSMIKRKVGVKDSGTIIPGHGGALDRIDSILWAGVIGYYYVLWIVT